MNSRTYGAGRPLVLLHGWGLNSGVWDVVLPRLASQFEITCIDLPGCGVNAGSLPEPYSLENISAQLAKSIPAHSIVVGWSLGGLIAQYLALHYPHKVAVLVGVATTPCFEQKSQWPGIHPATLKQFQRQLALNFQTTLARFLAIQALGSPNAKSDIKQLQQSISRYPAPALSALKQGLKLLSNTDMRAEIARITQPTLNIYGRLDSLVPATAVELIEQLQPAASQTVIAHAAHAPFVSHPEEWLSALFNFFDSQ
ncbi:pimeloyl-ACP methyl ester esterase BioH [Alteromonas sp. SM 2104]|nr:pimeloyl-ACP methyl ester esterase BioH [Alteromonas oceanisediminis]